MRQRCRSTTATGYKELHLRQKVSRPGALALAPRLGVVHLLACAASVLRDEPPLKPLLSGLRRKLRCSCYRRLATSCALLARHPRLAVAR